MKNARRTYALIAGRNSNKPVTVVNYLPGLLQSHVIGFNPD